MSGAPYAARWTDVAEAYAGSFATLCAGTIPTLVADLAPAGRRVLEVGCGTGDLAAALAEAGGLVTALDQDPAMLALAAPRLKGAPGPVQGALPRLPFADRTFDVVVANFVVNHLADPRAGVAELTRVCAAGGLVAMTGWTSATSAQSALLGRVSDDSGADVPAGIRLSPEMDFDRSVEGWTRLATEAGLVVQHAGPLSWDWRVAPVALWSGIQGGVSTLGVTYRVQTAQMQERMRALFFTHAAGLVEDGLLVLPSTAAYVLARVS